MGPAVLDDRALGRATLARQLLLERADLGPAEAVSRLVGLQAQTPQTWYVSLWSRLVGFDPGAVSALLEQRELVRIALMRSTLHLVTAEDCLALRPLFDPVNERGYRANHARGLVGVDPAELAEAGRELLAAWPMTFSELGDRLLQRWPTAQKSALGQGVRALVPLVQVPPRGLWGRSGPVAHTTVQAWLGRDLVAEPSIETLVLRYLGAFGPASVRDVQNWSGLTRLAPVLERLRPGLVTFAGADGRELFDLPDAPRPDPQVPAPVRYLADFDNLLLGHADRSRFVSPEYRALGVPANGQGSRPFLLDGVTGGTWDAAAERGTWALTVRPFRPLRRADRSELEREGHALLRFLATGAVGAGTASTYAVRFAE